MKRIIFFIATTIIAGNVSAQKNKTVFENKAPLSTLLEDVKPSYLDDAIANSGLDANWFFYSRFGANAFVGSPLGCNDLFGRMKPMLNIGVGKWITPKLGIRISFQGFTFKDCGTDVNNCFDRNFQNYHADVFFNVADYFHNTLTELPKWDFAPYVGLGLIVNNSNGEKPFAFSYGVFTRYRLSKRIHLSADIGCTNTFKNFDGKGAKGTFGDNLLQGSIGFDITIGKSGWKRVLDVSPYQQRNKELINYISVHQNCDTLADAHKYERIKYSGILSLRQRLHDASQPEEPQPSVSTSSSCIGTPVYFFFKKNTYKLIDKAQLVNIKRIAHTAIKNDFKVRIIGAADDYSGTDKRNRILSNQRAGYIALMLCKKGMKKNHIVRESEGGVKFYSLVHANRFARVELYK